MFWEPFGGDYMQENEMGLSQKNNTSLFRERSKTERKKDISFGSMGLKIVTSVIVSKVSFHMY